MKRLGVYAFIVVLLAIMVGGYLSPQTSFAQSTVTVDQILQHASPIFQDKLSALNNELTAYASNHGGTGSAQYNTYRETNTAMANAVRAAKTVFENTLVSNASGKTPSQLYGDALLAAANSLGSQSNSNPILQRPEATTFITAFRNELTTEASTQERIRAITTGQALSPEAQQNAAASTAAASPSSPANKPTDGQCKWYNFTISACIDEGFTWIIKNTLLQLAGFLLWLTAQMLNFAIQISILDFAKWAPDSLYPIWIVIRQIVSLVVVFAGLYLGFMYIIGRQDTFGKYVGWLVIFALFVNFSYPVTRALVDVSNIISLNVYVSAVGSEPLAGGTTSTAGGLIMAKMGLQDLAASATKVAGAQSNFIKNINSTPGALLAVAFVLYAAYIFFMATAIIATRTAVLVFLIVASPLLLLDSVIPKLGDVAMKMRKMFFEQLAVAPVFMIMLALTLKFMDIFQTSGVLTAGSATSGALTSSGEGTIKVFFGILMMLIMLHIMLKVTRSLAGEAGNLATNAMGKVGGFGLGVATGGAGLLARGTIGAAAARARDSGWMDRMKDTRIGRGAYGLTNSLAQSTYDVRNVGLVSKGMATAGLTGMGGLGMQKGIAQGYDQRKKSREEEVVKFGSNIRDDTARASYFSKVNDGRLVKVGAEKLRETEREVQDKRSAAIVAYTKAKPEERSSMLDKAGNDYVLREKLRAADQYLAPNVKDPNDPDAIKKKVSALVKVGDSDVAKKMIDNDPFAEIQDEYKKEIEMEEAALETADRKKEIFLAGADGHNTKTTEYEMKRKALAEKKARISREISGTRKKIFDEYQKQIGAVPAPFVDFELPDETPGSAGGNAPILNTHPGGSDTARYDSKEYEKPAYLRNPGAPGAGASTPTEEAAVAHPVSEDLEKPAYMRNRAMTSEEVVNMQKSFNLNMKSESFAEAMKRRKNSPDTASTV